MLHLYRYVSWLTGIGRKVTRHSEFCSSLPPGGVRPNDCFEYLPPLEIRRTFGSFFWLLCSCNAVSLVHELATLLQTRIGYEIKPGTAEWRDIRMALDLAQSGVSNHGKAIKAYREVASFDEKRLLPTEPKVIRVKYWLADALVKDGIASDTNSFGMAEREQYAVVVIE
jgi:hypothetical protein